MSSKRKDKTHDRIVNLLFNLVEKTKEYDKKEPYSKANPIHIHVRKSYTPYHPDIWARTKKGEIDIYEVWNTEDDRQAASDI